MQLDRTQAPKYEIIKSIKFPRPERVSLDNGVDLHVINVGDQPVLRLECIFEGGAWTENVDGASHFAIKMLSEGTEIMSSSQISEAFDSIGAFVELNHTADRTGIMVYCLAKFLPQVLPVVRDLIGEATLPEKEWKDLQNITLQNFRVNQQKTSWVASNEFRRLLFGGDHPYGRMQNEDQIVAFERSDAKDYYEKNIKNCQFRVILSGQVSSQAIGLVNTYLGQIKGLSPFERKPGVDPSIAPSELFSHLVKSESLQSSLRIGQKLFTRSHPDYFKMLVANEILGGYFGSRLMKNIREEKGLTYGISSHVISLRNEGYFMIGADVANEFTNQALEEIEKEIRTLQHELVPDHELQNVKNFMTGEFAGSLNTAFEVADRQKILILDNLPDDFFERFVDQIHETSAEDILQVASTHLKIENMIKVVAG